MLGRGSWPFAIAGTNNVVESETHAMMVATPKVSIGVTADVVDREPEIRLGNVAETGIDTHQSGIRWPTNYVT